MGIVAYSFEGEAPQKQDPELVHAPGSPLVEARRACVRVANSDTPVVFSGEPGTGKRAFARMIHDASARASEGFVSAACAGFDPATLEAEIFGDGDLPGRVHEARGGTLFLDEVSILSKPAQRKLLRLLQENVCEPAGRGAPCSVDIRVLAATTEPLARAVESGRFLSDLYYQLGVYPVSLPALRDRPEDIQVLFDHLWQERGDERALMPDARRALRAYSWPGNVRELQSFVVRLSVSVADGVISGDHVERMLLADKRAPAFSAHQRIPLPSRSENDAVPEAFDQAPYPRVSIDMPIDLPNMLRALENAYIDAALTRTTNNKKEAAGLLGMGRTTLVEKLRRRSADKHRKSKTTP